MVLYYKSIHLIEVKMKIHTRFLSLLITLGLSIAAHATPMINQGQPYVGLKIGQANADINNHNTDRTTAYGVYTGYEWKNGLGIEADFHRFADGKATYMGDSSMGTFFGDSYGIYTTYRQAFGTSPLYGKVKLGIARTTLESETGFDSNHAPIPNPVRITHRQNETSTSLAGAVGVGYTIHPSFALEADYQYANTDTKFWTIGGHYKF